MTFTFQINDSITFNRNETWILTAEDNKPTLKSKTIYPKRLVDVQPNKDSLGGVKVSAADLCLNKLADYSFNKGEKLIIDFGDHYVGHFKLAISTKGSQMDAPLYFKIRFAETPAELMMEAADYDGWLSSSWIAEEKIHFDVLPATFIFPRRYSFRYVAITVLDTSPKWQVTFEHPELIAESSVDLATVKTIETDDSLLKRIDEVSLKTLGDCMQLVFEDGPKRDQRLWLGDLRLQSLTNYLTFGETAIVKRCLYLFAALTAEDGRVSANIFTKGRIAADDTFLFDYSLFFISSLKDYYEYSNDLKTVNDLYSIAKKQIDLAIDLLNDEFLLKLNEDWPVFIDWSNDMDKNTAAQAVLIYVLKDFLQLARLVKEPEFNFYLMMCQRLEKAAKKQLFSKDKGFFVSGTGEEINLASQIWMILANVLEKEEQEKLAKKVLQRFFPIKGIATPYMYHHVAEALFQTGMKVEAIQLIKDYWGKMISLGADTFWEAFMPEDINYSPYGRPLVNSYCHAWSCTPAYLFRKYLTD